MMQLKRRVMDPKLKDEISEVLAYQQPSDPDAPGGPTSFRVVPHYIFNHYPKGLRERCFGPHSRDLVGVTRFYPRLTPPVVIDFEPPPPDPWFRDEKLQFFSEQGIAYVPLTLRDALTVEAFAERVEAARRLAVTVRQESSELAALAGVGKDVESWMQDPVLVASIDAEVVALLEQETESRGKPLFGAARLRRLAAIKTRIIRKLREDLKRGRIVDPLQRHREPASAAQ
jgi:hypothetical protein